MDSGREEKMSTCVRFRFAVIALLSLSALPVVGQTGNQSGGNPSSSGNRNTNTPGTTSSTPRTQPNPPQERQIYFVEGRVLLADGNPPPEPVPIERVCNGNAKREAYTDSKGRFQFQLGSNPGILQDATESDFDAFGSNRGSMPGQTQGVSRRELLGCELRAVLPGYQSGTVMIRPEGNFGQLEVGTIVLKPMGNSEGAVISLTSMKAPKDAKHAFEKGQKAANDKKLPEAEKQLQKAVTVYPQFAAAWSMLGAVHSELNQTDLAYKDYEQAITADPKFVNPYYGLSVLSMKENKWNEVVRYTDETIKLNPYAFPVTFLFNAAANFNLGNLDAAEKSARKFIIMDSEHRRPEVALLLGEILARKHDYAGALAQKRSYLAMAPNAPNSQAVREDVKRLEALSQNPN
jgi:Tfp pilus assembly protein PilF